MWFAKKQQEDVKVNNPVEKETVEEEVKEEPVKPVEEWIWVTGYKATEADMKCRDYQYVMKIRHDMPEDAEIEECQQGFHFCKELADVFKYYGVGNGHRFFRVLALVRKEDYERYGKYTKEYEVYLKHGGHSYSWHNPYYVDKLVAKSIVFDSELTSDEILVSRIDLDDPMWTDEYKKLALEGGIEYACDRFRVDNLVKLGYSLPFAQLIIESAGRYERALAVAAQSDLSMDMKCWLIFK